MRSRTSRRRSGSPCTSTSGGASWRACASASRSRKAASRPLEELARAAEIDLHHAQEALEAVEATVSLNRPVGDDADGELGDLFADPDVVDAAEEAERSLRDAGIRRAVAALPERERRVVELRFGFDGESLTLEAIGRELGLTRERVRQLEQSAFAKLAGDLEGVLAAGGDDLADSA